MALKPIPQPLLRITILRDRDNCPHATGTGHPWITYCPCCARRGGYGFLDTFTTWQSAIDWAVHHVHTTHTTAAGSANPHQGVLL